MPALWRDREAGMMNRERILGYRPNGEPIFDIPIGHFATAAFVMCDVCGAPIRSMGGPIVGALCVPCHEAMDLEPPSEP